MRVTVLTTSYPRSLDDYAGRFVADQVERLRARGLELDVVAPGSFRHFGLCYGAGVVGNARRRPWALPALLVSMALAVRRSARGSDLVHAHWLPAAAIALLAGRPVVATLHGTDLELARRLPWLARLVLRRVQLTICVSSALETQARRLGAERTVVIPNGVEIPVRLEEEEEDDPPYALFVGRLSPEKGIEDLQAVSEGLNLVVVGDGPLRPKIPSARGWVTQEELHSLYARAAVVVCPSRREGFGLVCAEAMAHGKPVVATATGGLLDLVLDGQTGALVPAGDSRALRGAIDALLADRARRTLLGERARAVATDRLAWPAIVSRLAQAYVSAAAGAVLPTEHRRGEGERDEDQEEQQAGGAS